MLLFEGWTPLIKARQAIGLQNWKKLEHAASKLQGKAVKDITFTSSHPMYNQEPVKHTLGSTTGNMMFLQGYCSPGFHIAPYHWQLVDPYLTDEEAAKKEHPARPDLWKQSGLPLEAEGDLTDGKPHPSFKAQVDKTNSEQDFKREAVFARSGYGRYIGIPSMGIVFGVLDKKLYKWSLVRGSFLAAVNPEFFTAMEEGKENTVDDDVFIDKSIDSFVLSKACASNGTFDQAVYPVVKQLFPKPGTIIDMQDCYGVVGPRQLEFISKQGGTGFLDVFDKSISSLDLCYTEDSLHPSVLLNFMETYLNIPRESVVGNVHKATSSNEVSFVDGTPTVGSDNWDLSKQSTTREVAYVDGVYKVVSRT